MNQVLWFVYAFEVLIAKAHHIPLGQADALIYTLINCGTHLKKISNNI